MKMYKKMIIFGLFLIGPLCGNASEQVGPKKGKGYVQIPISIGESSDATVGPVSSDIVGYIGLSLVPNFYIREFRPLIYGRVGSETPLIAQSRTYFGEIGFGLRYEHSIQDYFQVTVGQYSKPDNLLDSSEGGWKSLKSRINYYRYFPGSNWFIWNVGVLFEQAKYDDGDDFNKRDGSHFGIEAGLTLML